MYLLSLDAASAASIAALGPSLNEDDGKEAALVRCEVGVYLTGERMRYVEPNVPSRTVGDE